MRRRAAALAAALLVTLPGCTVVSPASDDTPDDGRLYRVKIEQTRRGRGLEDTPSRHVSISARLLERPNGSGVTIDVKDVDAEGEPTQVAAAERLVGKSVSVIAGPGGIQGMSLGLGGDADLNAIDVALLFQVVSPMIPGRPAPPTSRAISGLRVPWSESIELDVRHEITGKRWTRWILADIVNTKATGRLVFRLPIAREAPPSSGTSRKPLVDEVFQSLFAIAEEGGPVGALTAGIAAIPLGIAAPFIALGDALSGIFGGGSRGPRRVTIPLEGPIELNATSAIGASDSRELRTTGRGSMRLKGKLPELSGNAARLSGRPLTLDADWTYSKQLIKPWPFGILVWALLLIAANVAALAIVTLRRRRSAAIATAA